MTTSENTYTLHLYDPKFAAGMAQMWNESDHQWPGTFTRGVPFDEQRIIEWMERVAAVIKFVIQEDQTGKIVGYGDLWEENIRPGALYVALLNVHPDHQGNSLARRMLHEMINYATEHGYDKVTIGTWPANLKAMPLYKKVGFFWQPGTSVFMENYIPTVRQLPLAKGFFERHDWYRNYKRELKQIEDEMRHPKTGNTKVYTLRWEGRLEANLEAHLEAGGDFLEAVFDRNGQRLTGLANNNFAAYARIGESEPAQGVTYPIEWEVENHSPRMMSVSLFASGDPGIEITHRATFNLAPGESRVLTATYRVTPDAPKFEVDNKEKITPRINTLLVIDGQVLEFGSGLRYRPPVEFSLGPAWMTWMPGKSKTAHLQLKNRTKQPLDIVVTITPDSAFDVDWLRQTITAPAEGRVGLPLVITPTRTDEIPLTVRASFTIDGQTITTPPKKLPLLALEAGGLAAGQDEDAVIVENEFFRLHTKRKGAWTTVSNKTLRNRTAVIVEELGPPFVPWDLEDRMFDLHLTRENGAVKLMARVPSGRFPGLVLTREMTITASPLITVRHRIVNTGSTSQEFQLRPNVEFLRFEQTHLTVPLKQRFVREHGSHFGIAHNDIPEDPSRLAEPWIAYEETGAVAGAIWSADTEKLLSQFGDFFPFGHKQTLAPQEVYVSNPLYVFVGPGDWRTIRQTWANLTGTKIEAVTPKRFYNMELAPVPLVTLDDRVDTCLKLTSTRELALAGEVEITLPDGWTASKPMFPLEELTVEKPLEFPISFNSVIPQTGAFEGELRLNTQRFDHTQPFTLIRLGRSTEVVQVTQSQREGYDLWKIANGLTAWEIAPAFHGGIISWQEINKETNHVFTAFPEDGELSWMKPYFGGLRPTLHDPHEERGWPGKLHTEKFSTVSIEACDAHGLPWKGLRLAADLQKENLRGLRVELDYLTLPGSNALKFVYRLINQTSTYRELEPGFLFFPNVDGDREHVTLHNAELHRKKTDQVAWTISKGWAAVENTNTGRAMVVVPASGSKRSQLADWGNAGGNIHLFHLTELAPAGNTELVAYLALTGSLEEAKRYEVLGG